MEWEDPDKKIHDVDVSTATPQALSTFLQQFHDINTHWDNQYEGTTENIITLCAEIQSSLIDEFGPSSNGQPEENLLIAHSLRCLAISHYISEVTGWLPGNRSKEQFRQEMFLQPERVSDWENNPSVEISRYKKHPATSTNAVYGLQLDTMLQHIVRIGQQMILGGKFSDLPALLCFLCLLQLIQSNLQTLCSWLDNFDPGEQTLDEVRETLCKLYEIAAQGHHPLLDDWDKNAYGALVGRNSLALEHMSELNELWAQEGM